MEEYIAILKENIIKSNKLKDCKTKEEMDKEIINFTNKIEEYIMRKIYKSVYRDDYYLAEDTNFYNKTKELSWIVPEQLDIKKLYVNQLRFALSNIRKMDEAKSVYEKIRCIENAFTNISNSIKFSTGKATPGQEEVTPILHYTIIKAQPQRFISQLNYIKCFRDLSKGGKSAFMVTQLQSSVTFIMNLDHTKLKITKEEFDKNIKEAKTKKI